MPIRVLGCSGAIAAGCRTTSFLLDEAVLIDAGTGVGDLSLAELARIDHICISHSHLDHVLSIGLLADSVMRERLARQAGPITIHALPQTLAALKTHIFNGVIWPDFTRLPSVDAPALRLQAFDVGQVLQLAGRQIEVLPATHTVPAVGFAVKGDPGYWVFTGDTGPNPALWERLRTMELAHLVIETAFSNEEHALAELSQHLVPAHVRTRADAVGSDGSVQVHVTHIKPGEAEAVMAQVRLLQTTHQINPLEVGQVLAF
jgi:ribonuclease BN (tRNA processing enzyme)